MRPAWHTIQSGPLAGRQLYFPNPTGGWKLMIEGVFDDFIYTELKNNNLQGACCWDIGAHFGYHSLAFAALGANVIAFEPNPHNAAQIRKNLEKNPDLIPRIKQYPLAISNQDGEMPFIQSTDLSGPSSGSHLQDSTTPFAEYPGFEKTVVKTLRIDSLITQGERVPDVIKIDVEGAEDLVLSGGEKFFESHKPLVLMEVHHICLMYSAQKFLSEKNYQLSILDKSNASPSRCFIIAMKR